MAFGYKRQSLLKMYFLLLPTVNLQIPMPIYPMGPKMYAFHPQLPFAIQNPVIEHPCEAKQTRAEITPMTVVKKENTFVVVPAPYPVPMPVPAPAPYPIPVPVPAPAPYPVAVPVYVAQPPPPQLCFKDMRPKSCPPCPPCPNPLPPQVYQYSPYFDIPGPTAVPFYRPCK